MISKRLFRGRGFRQYTPAFCYFIILLCLVSCVAPNRPPYQLINFTQFQDLPITPEVSAWLEGGKQSRITPEIAAVASRISGSNRRERLYKAVDYIWRNFQYDDWYNDKAFVRTADQLFKERRLGGCSDYALAKVTLFRALGIPARLVLTANVDWMLSYQKNDLLISTGHIFIEAFLEDKWHLVDSTYRFLFLDYNSILFSYPRREYFCLRGRDYWESGITNLSALDEILRNNAMVFHEELYSDPSYDKMDI